MGKKGSWFSAVKKFLSHDSRKDKKIHRLKKKCTQKDSEEAPIEDVKLTEAESEQNKHAISLAFAATVAAGAAVAAAQAAAEVVRLTSMPLYPGKTEEDMAAIKIQTAFRGYLARRALCALRGLVRLKALMRGKSVKRQATSTLRCMQTLARLQSEVRERRIRVFEENRVLQRQLQQKHQKELIKLQTGVGEEWDDRLQSKEQIEAKLLQRQEAALKRERALAYSFSHQQTWKNTSKSTNLTFMNPNNPHWGWSWLERSMATRPWEDETIMNHNDHASKAIRPASTSTTPASKATRASSSKSGRDIDDSRSMYSVHSKRYRRYSSIAGSSMKDDESIESSPAFPSYMALTSSAKARSKVLQRPSPSPSSSSTIDSHRPNNLSAKKRLSFPASPIGSRRHSGPPKVEI